MNQRQGIESAASNSTRSAQLSPRTGQCSLPERRESEPGPPAVKGESSGRRGSGQ